MSEDSLELPKSTSVEPEDLLSMVDGIPLPPGIKKNLWKSLGRLITGVIDIPVAYLDSKSESIKGETTALNLFRNRVAEKASTVFTDDHSLMNRAVNYYGSKLLKEQLNREKVFDQTAIELESSPPIEDTNKEIDEDWLDNFSRLAETKSKAEMQLILAKILSGEIKKPGSYSYNTLQVLANLDQETGEIFQKLCSITYEIVALPDSSVMVIHSPFKNPGSNGLTEYGLSYSTILNLQDAGLLLNTTSTSLNVSYDFFITHFTIGSKEYQLQKTVETTDKEVNIKTLNLTKAGKEIRRVMEYKNDISFNEKLIEWVKTNFNLS